MNIDISLVLTGAELAIGASASKGAKILVHEAVKQLTPENLKASEQLAVKIAEYGASVSVGAICAAGATKTISTIADTHKKLKEMFDKSKNEDGTTKTISEENLEEKADEDISAPDYELFDIEDVDEDDLPSFLM